MLTRTIYLSLDPYQWGRKRSGLEAVGEVCHGRTVSQVVKSKLPEYNEGDFIFNTNGWQEYGLSGEGISVFGYMFPRKLDPAQAPLSTAVGIMGMLGLTAYSGMALQCQPKAGETVVVSAASGGVGQIAGQIAKIFGCRVVGIAGIKEKCDFVTGVLGFDACVSHKSDLFRDQAACPLVSTRFERRRPIVTAVLRYNRRRLSLWTRLSMVPPPGDPRRPDSRGRATFGVSVPGPSWCGTTSTAQAHFCQMADWIRQESEIQRRPGLAGTSAKASGHAGGRQFRRFWLVQDPPWTMPASATGKLVLQH
jgi:hypothetical protein